jgi:hypothetical protein
MKPSSIKNHYVTKSSAKGRAVPRDIQTVSRTRGNGKHLRQAQKPDAPIRLLRAPIAAWSPRMQEALGL